MIEIIKSIFDFFFGENFPDFTTILYLFPLTFIYTISALQIGLYFQKRYRWKVGYTRKFFHFLVFGLAGILQFLVGIGGVFVLGWSVSIMIAYIIRKGNKTPYYSLLARPKDKPHPTRYILYPYVATFLGGVFNNYFLTPICAVTGYLIAGLGDAVGEPAGTRWGKHFYPVFSFGSSVKSYRSVEGSLAVLIASIFVFVITSYFYHIDLCWIKIIIAAVVVSFVEGISPHGWDNFTMQVAGAILMKFYLM